jgi:peptide methionine sulfoxide reductase MsrA
MSENTETAILAGGCFWPAQELLRHRDGVLSTRVGYTGGENDNPTADNHPGHAEAVEVIFDPERTTYRDILGPATLSPVDPNCQAASFCSTPVSIPAATTAA